MGSPALPSGRRTAARRLKAGGHVSELRPADGLFDAEAVEQALVGAPAAAHAHG
jgi:hypothetical protein